MKDQFSLDNPELIGLATIRIAYLNSDPEKKQQGSILTDLVFTPDLDFTNLSPESMQPHVILAGVATKAIRDFLENSQNNDFNNTLSN
jgi:hypothetical protein